MKKTVRRTITVIMSAMFALALAIGAAAADCGDVNGDTKVNSGDILAIKRHIVGIELSDNCDADGDGKVNAKDILAIKRHIVGIESLHKWETTENISCTDGGTIVTACTRCGKVASEEIVPAPGHDFADGICTRCGASEEIAIESISIATPDRKYIIGESPDFRDSAMTVHFTDGTSEDIVLTHSVGDVNYNVGYYCEKLDREISFYIDTPLFTESGKQTVAVVECGGATCEVEFIVESVTIISLTVQDNFDGDLTLIAGLSDGSTREMKLLDIDVRAGSGDGVSSLFQLGFLITDNGTFEGSITFDTESFEIYISVYSGGNNVRSNALDDSLWVAGYIYATANAPYMFYISGEIPCYSGTINESNIDALIKLAAIRSGLNQIDEETLPRDEVTGDMLIPADAMSFIMALTYGDVEFDLADSSLYDGEADVIRLPDMAFGGYMPVYPMTRTYEDGVWTITVTDAGWNKTVTFCVDEMNVITELDFDGHKYENEVCSVCGKLSADYYTEGLMYDLAKGDTSYFVMDIGKATDKVIVVPDTYNGLPVIGIGKTAFYNADITKVILPDSIEWIGPGAFSESKLKSIRMPAHLEELGYEAFYGCENLKSIDLPGSLKTISHRVFKNCTNLETITIGYGTEEISDAAFWGITCDPVILIPSSVRRISTDAFLGSESAYTLVYDGTLDDWKNISVKLYPDRDALNVTVVCDDGVYDIYEIYDRPSPDFYTEGLEYTISEDGTYYIVTNINGVTDEVIVVPDTYNGLPVKMIGKGAFYSDDNNTTKEIILPDSIVSIGAGAFVLCELESIHLPKNLEYLGEAAFDRCIKLKSIELPGSLKKINDRTFFLCFDLQYIVIGDGVEEICCDAFVGNSYDAMVSMPASIKKIDVSAFRGRNTHYQIYYDGTLAEWNSINLYSSYPSGSDDNNATVYCHDGITSLDCIY